MIHSLLPPPAIGDKIALGKKDYWGRTPEKLNHYILVSLPQCGACAARRLPKGALKAHFKYPVVVVTQDNPKAMMKELKTSPKAVDYAFSDPDGHEVGPGMMFYSPRAAEIVDGKITAVDIGDDNVGEFLKRYLR